MKQLLKNVGNNSMDLDSFWKIAVGYTDRRLRKTFKPEHKINKKKKSCFLNLASKCCQMKNHEGECKVFQQKKEEALRTKAMLIDVWCDHSYPTDLYPVN